METTELIAMIREGVRGADPGDTMIFPETGKIICVAELLEVADRLESVNKRWKRTVVERDQARQMRERAERLLAEKTSGDLISREALLEEFRWLKSQVGEARAAEYDEIMERIAGAEAVDAVAVVRCGECKYGDDEGGTALNFRVCRLSKRSELLDWYCPYGKRRTRNGE